MQERSEKVCVHSEKELPSSGAEKIRKGLELRDCSGGAAQVGLLRWALCKVPAQVELLRWTCSSGPAQVRLLRWGSYKVPAQVGLRKWVRCQSASLKVAAQVGHNATPPHDPTL